MRVQLVEARLRSLESVRMERLLQVIWIHVLELAVIGQTMRHLLCMRESRHICHCSLSSMHGGLRGRHRERGSKTVLKAGRVQVASLLAVVESAIAAGSWSVVSRHLVGECIEGRAVGVKEGWRQSRAREAPCVHVGPRSGLCVLGWICLRSWNSIVILVRADGDTVSR